MLGRVMLALGGLVVAVLFLALLVPFFVDWSSFRVAFEDQASRLLGKKVSVHGSVDARILPFPSVTLHDVRIGQDVDGQPLMQAKQFSMDMELAPFLSGEARIFDMRIDEPRVKIRILKDGTLEWLRGSRAAIASRNVVIEDIHVNDGEFVIVDERTGQTRHLTGFTAQLAAGSLRGPWRGEGNASLDGNEAQFTLTSGELAENGHAIPLRMKILPDAQPVQVDFDGELSVADNKPVYDGKFNLTVLQEEDESEPVVAPPPGPRVAGDFELTQDRIRVPQYRLEVGALDNPYVVTGEATLDTGTSPEFLLTADGQQIDVNRLADGAGSHGKTGRDPAASAQRRINAFVGMMASIPIPQVPGRASLKLPAIVINDTTIRDIRLDLRPAGRGWAVDNGVAMLPGRTQLEAKGMLNLADRTAFVGDMLVASTQPSGLADWLSGRVDPAIRQLKTAGFSAKVNLTPDLQRFDNLELAIGAASLKGQLERQSLPRQMPRLSVALAGNEIDIDAMRALASLVTGGDAGQELLDHRVVATLKADRVNALGVAATKVDTAFTMAQGVLSLERLNVGNIEGASISAKGRLEGSLLSYGGSGTVSFKSDDPTAFIAMLRDRLPRHPALDRLARNARWYQHADLSADISVGRGGLGGAEAKLSGKANGSVIKGSLSLPGLFDLTASDEMQMSVSVDNPNAPIILGQVGLDPLPFDGDGAGRLSVSLTQSAPGSARRDSDNPVLADLSFATPRTTVTAKGRVNLDDSQFGHGSAHISLNSADLEPYLLVLGLGLPQFGDGMPARLDADIALSDDKLQLSGIAGEIAGNSLTGDLMMDRKADTLPVTGRLATASADLSWLAETVFGPLTAPATGLPSKTKLSAPMFGGLDVAVDVKAGHLQAEGLGRVDDFSGKIIQRGNALTIEDAKGTWHGGPMSGRLMMSNGQGTGIVQGRIEAHDADLGQFVWSNASGAPVASGKLGFTLSAEASGQSMNELLHGLGGSGEIRLSAVDIAGLNADALVPIMAAADKLQGSIGEDQVRRIALSQVHQGTASLAPLTIPLTIAAGEARLQDVTASAGAAKVSGQGQFNPVDNRIDAQLSVSYDAGDEAVDGGEPSIRLLYAGPLDAPEQSIDVSAMTNFLSLRAFEQQRRRVETLQASVLEKQRLRREVGLYMFRDQQRQAARQKAEAEERARRAAAEAERARRDVEPDGGASPANGEKTSPAPFSMQHDPDFGQPSPPPTSSGNASVPGVQP